MLRKNTEYIFDKNEHEKHIVYVQTNWTWKKTKCSFENKMTTNNTEYIFEHKWQPKKKHGISLKNMKTKNTEYVFEKNEKHWVYLWKNDNNKHRVFLSTSSKKKMKKTQSVCLKIIKMKSTEYIFENMNTINTE